MRKSLLTICLFFISRFILAQDRLQADRPSENLDPQTVPAKKFQAEIGFDRRKDNGTDYSWRHPNGLFRYGITDKFELRMELTAETQKSFSENNFRYGLQPVQMGLKAEVFETKDQKFTTSFFGQAGIPQLSSADHDPGKWFHRIRVLFENHFSDKVRLGYNFGSDWDSGEGEQNWIYTITPQLQLTEHWDVFIELYGHFRNDHPDHNLNGGLAYFIGKNAQLDLSGSIGLTPHSPRCGISAGFTILFR